MNRNSRRCSTSSRLSAGHESSTERLSEENEEFEMNLAEQESCVGFKTIFKCTILVIALTAVALGVVYSQNEVETFSGDISIKRDLYRLRKEVEQVQSSVHSMSDYNQFLDKKLANVQGMLHETAQCSAHAPMLSMGTSKDGHIKRLIEKELSKKEGMDKTVQVDYALESTGGKVISTPNTEIFELGSDTVSVFGLPICRRTRTAATMIQPGNLPGECWAFKGSKGEAVIRLIGKVAIKGVTLEHIPKKLSPSGHVRSAPRNFCIYGMNSEDDEEPKLLGRYTYQINGPAVQYFEIRGCSKGYRYVLFKVTSNHGEIRYTCIYRLRVHGKLECL